MERSIKGNKNPCDERVNAACRDEINYLEQKLYSLSKLFAIKSSY
jgi:hypothetical protein